MLEAANARPRFTISLKRSTQNLQLSTSRRPIIPSLLQIADLRQHSIEVRGVPIADLKRFLAQNSPCTSRFDRQPAPLAAALTKRSSCRWRYKLVAARGHAKRAARAQPRLIIEPASCRRFLEICSHLVPVHRVLPNVDVFAPLGLALEAVGVLPYVDGQDRLGAAVDMRSILVGGAEGR